MPVVAGATLLVSCGLPAEPGQSAVKARTNQPAIQAEKVLDAAGNCTGRRETVTLHLGEFTVLGQYGYDTDGGWKFTYSALGSLAVDETVDDAHTQINQDFTPGFNLTDLPHNATETLTIPNNVSSVEVGKPEPLALYAIKGGNAWRGDNDRNGESGVISISLTTAKDGYILTNLTTFSNDERRQWCG